MVRFLIPAFLLSAAVLPLRAGEPQDALLAESDQKAIDVLFTNLRQSFLAGNHRLLHSLLTARDAAEAERRDELVRAARREFKMRSYGEFEVRGWSLDGTPGADRLDLWVNLRTVCVNPEQARVENYHNDAFLVERQADGSFQFVDSPFFLTLGQQQGVGLIADALLAVIGSLVALVFWVWMGFAAFSLRPRRPVWRVAVMLLPLVGALAFFLLCYLPAWFRGTNVRDGARA